VKPGCGLDSPTVQVAQASTKKVLIARFDREPLEGFVQASDGWNNGTVELLTPAGAILQVPFADVKAVCFVRDFGAGETWREHRAFLARPKASGLWLRLRFRDGDSLEGIAPNDLLRNEPSGFNVTPPDPTFQNQRIFVPREALSRVEVLGVIGSPLRRPRPIHDEQTQIKLFE
jgi:hypothetical protein